jgi:DNA helicase-2/ATP-dependent DNA helicase PcrA
VDLTAERWQVRQDARKNLYTGKTYNSVENVAQFFKERGVPVRSPLSRPVPSQAKAPAPVKPPVESHDERMPWDEPAIQRDRPVPVPPPAATTPLRRPSAVQGGLFGTPAPPTSPRPPQLIPPIQSRTVLPQAPPAPRRPAQTGTVVEHPKYGKGTIVRREGEGDDSKIVVIFQRHGMKKLVEKYAGLKRS